MSIIVFYFVILPSVFPIVDNRYHGSPSANARIIYEFLINLIMNRKKKDKDYAYKLD
jgi:hypothetical protein